MRFCELRYRERMVALANVKRRSCGVWCDFVMCQYGILMPSKAPQQFGTVKFSEVIATQCTAQ